MDKEQFYLKLIEEECAEIIQVCSKASRFGIDNYHKDLAKSNRIRLKEEINDLFAVLQLLQDECNINTEADEYMINEKLYKVEKYKKFSIELGKVHE